MLHLVLFVCVVEGLGVDGGWMPLPTRPQQYYDPASLGFDLIGFNAQ